MCEFGSWHFDFQQVGDQTVDDLAGGIRNPLLRSGAQVRVGIPTLPPVGKPTVHEIPAIQTSDVVSELERERQAAADAALILREDED